MRLKVSARAADDLMQVYVESARSFGDRQAERYYQDILAVFDHLIAFPLASHIREEYRGSVRVWHYESHRIVYRVTKREVVIVRVVHSLRDLKRHL